MLKICLLLELTMLMNRGRNPVSPHGVQTPFPMQGSLKTPHFDLPKHRYAQTEGFFHGMSFGLQAGKRPGFGHQTVAYDTIGSQSGTEPLQGV
jgi:hypothetical protein